MQKATQTGISLDTSPKFGFNLDALKPGDILLSVDDDKLSRGIAKFTRGEFSHAMLYIGYTFIHAMTDGVYSKNPQRYLRSDATHLAAYRLLPEYSMKVDFAAICDFARNQVGALYSVPQAIMAGPQKKPYNKDKSGKQFCSRLVAQAFGAIGISLVDNINFCTPNELACSPLLRRVDNIAKPLSEEDIAFSKTFDANAETQKRTYQWLDKTRRLSLRRGKKPIATLGDVLPMLVENPSLDKAVSGYMVDSGYAEFYDWDRIVNPWRYDSKTFLISTANEELLPRLNEEWGILQQDIERHDANLLASLENLRKFQYLKYCHLTHDLTVKLFEETALRRIALEETASILGVRLPVPTTR